MCRSSPASPHATNGLGANLTLDNVGYGGVVPSNTPNGHFYPDSPQLPEILHDAAEPQDWHGPSQRLTTEHNVDVAETDELTAQHPAEASKWDLKRGSPLYLEHVTYEVDYAVSTTSKNPLATKVTAHKVVLQDINAHIQPCDLVAIMGSSGAGKTTMLNIMAYRIQPTSGELYLSGHPASQIKNIHRHIAYVMQDDILMESLTVLECLRFAACLKLGNLDKVTRELRILEVLEELGLIHVRDTLIGSASARGISGGERKRTAIAIELLSRPAILFLDEPTSGLDSYTAEAVVASCKDLASHGHTVVATIHQPNSDIFKMFSMVMFLAKGQVVYNGPGNGAIGYFRDLGYECPQYTNPPDYFMKLLRVEMPKEGEGDTVASLKKDLGQARSEEFIAHWRRVEPDYLQPKGAIEPLEPPPPLPTWATQVRALFWRSFLNMTRNKLATRVRLVQSVFFGVFVGCIFLRLGYTQVDIQARIGAIFFTLVNQSLPALLGIVHTFPVEKAVLRRERANGLYTLFPYFSSKFLSELPSQILMPALFSSIFYWLVNLHAGVAQFFIFCAIVVLLSVTSCSLGLWISAMAPSVSIAMALSPAIMVPNILFGGFFAPTDAMPAWCSWIPYCSYYFYAFAACMKNEFTGETFTCDEPPCYTTGEEVLDRYAFEDVSIWANCVILVAFCIAYQMLGLFSLWLGARKHSA